MSKRKVKTKNGKMKLWKKILLVVIIVLLAAGAWFTYKTYKNGWGLKGMISTVVGHDASKKENLEEFKVLLLGVSTDIDAKLTDTIIVASYNPNTQKATLLSIPRDTFTGKNKNRATASEKINAIYNLTRDPEKTLKAVNDLTGLGIEYYVLVETQALIEIVDAIGNIEFNVPIDMDYDDPTQDLSIHLKAGLQKIDGDKAEQLLRFRHNNDGTTYPSEYGEQDLGRMRTQREFITEVAKQTLKLSNIFKLGELLDIVEKNVQTNVDFEAIKDYLPYAVEFQTENILTATLPGVSEKCNGVWLYVADEAETEKLIQELFYDRDIVQGEDTSTEGENSTTSTDTETNTTNQNTTSSGTSNVSGLTNAQKSEVSIELLNATGDSTQLSKVKELLEDEGYEVTKTGNTNTSSRTTITNKTGLDSKITNDIKDILGVGSISSSKSASSKVDITIVIGKDYL